MRVLINCEFSGRVREAFRNRGHDAYSCDLLESEDNSPYHWVGDAIEAAYKWKWDLMIAHPPCTYLCNSGVRWLFKDGKKNEERWELMEDAELFFLALKNAPIEKICLENPIPHGHVDLGPYTQTIQPYEHGEGETKRTCLWLKNLPKIIPTNIVDGRDPKVHWASPGKDRWKERSRTYLGIAYAFAEQWG